MVESTGIMEAIVEQLPLIMDGTLQTLIMTLLSTLLAYIIGLPLGMALVMTDPNGLHPMRTVNSALNAIVNILRSFPFIILLISILPLTRAIVGTTIGVEGAIPPLVIAAFPFIARLVESSLMEVDKGIIEAMQSMGASNMQIAIRALLPESMPSLITNATTATTTILGYTAMAGMVGAGGLGKIAIDYGYYRRNTLILVMAVVMLIVVVQVIQFIGGVIARSVDKRKN